MTQLPLVADPAAVMFAVVACLIVTIEYPVLVPVHRSPGSRLLMFLLIFTDVVLLLTVSRVIWGDWPGRYTLLTVAFWIWGAGMLFFGFQVWYQQSTAAKKRRRDKNAKRLGER